MQCRYQISKMSSVGHGLPYHTTLHDLPNVDARYYGRRPAAHSGDLSDISARKPVAGCIVSVLKKNPPDMGFN